MTRLWYVIRREGLNIPFPTAFEYGPGENPSPPEPSPADWLREHPRFKPALEHGDPGVVSFANGETAQGPGRLFEGFALVVAGRARLMADAVSGGAVQIGELGPGECFGESLTAGGAAEKISVVANGDLKVLVFSDAAIDDLLNKHSALASEIGDALEARRQAALAARKSPGKLS